MLQSVIDKWRLQLFAKKQSDEGVDQVIFMAAQPDAAGLFRVKGKGYEHEEFGSATGCTHFSGIGRLLHANRSDLAERHAIFDQGHAQRQDGRRLLRVHRYCRQAYSHQGR
ncbi:hypothetical protein METHPM2_500021 [Pseudomonas sp. PM2]